MSVLIDMNQIMISNLMVQIKGDVLNENLVRYMVLNSLRNFEKEYTPTYGEIILAYDSKNYWRKNEFPYYKQNRKKDRETSELDWNAIFEVLNKIRDEIKNYFPYKVVEIYGAEADDVICTLTKYQVYKNIKLQKEEKPIEKVFILSGDKDFIQLQKYPCVKQYNPIIKKEIKHDNPKVYLLEHIIKGDKSDGIPNFLSDSDTFVTNKRQKPISKKNLEKWINQDSSDFCPTEEIKANYERNKKLIDFDCVPEELSLEIVQYYKSLNNSNKEISAEYFRKYEITSLMDDFIFRNKQSHFEVK